MVLARLHNAYGTGTPRTAHLNDFGTGTPRTVQ